MAAGESGAPGGNQERRRWSGVALALFSAAAFGFHNVIARMALDGGSDPETLLALRGPFAAAAIYLYCRLRGRRLRIDGGARYAALGLGLVLALQSFGLLAAFQRIPVSLAILVFYTFPIMVAIYAVAVARARPSALTLLAILLAFAGLVLALDVSADGFDWEGVAFGGLAAAGMTVTILAGGRLTRTAGPVATSFHSILVSAGIFVFLVAVRGGPALPGDDAGWIAFAATPVIYLIAVMSFFLAIATISGPRVAIFLNVEPVIVIALAAALLGETLSPLQAAGAVLVVTAIFLARRPAKPAGAAAIE
jgi:drug/metabolite transporter (DMT)-like permease